MILLKISLFVFATDMALSATVQKLFYAHRRDSSFNPATSLIP